MSESSTHEPIAQACIEDLCQRLASNRRVRQQLPGGGKLNIDRLLPFLCVYRRNPQRRDAGTGLFVTAEAAFLYAPGDAPARQGLARLVQRLAETAAERLGGFLIVELWTDEGAEQAPARDPLSGEIVLPPPGFDIVMRPAQRPDAAVATLEFALQRIKVHRLAADVTITSRAANHPPGMTPLISAAAAEAIHCHVLGLRVRPIYRDPDSGDIYSHVLHVLRRGVTRALRKAFFTFAQRRTNFRPLHYYALGRKALPRNVWNVDRQLAEVSSQFKFLLLCTPVNAERSWREFMENNYEQEPVLQYRPLETDPLLLKRKLLSIRTEQIEDPALAHVLRQTQDELDRQIMMLSDVGTRRFLAGSLQVFGDVEAPLLEVAQDLLRRLPAQDEEPAEALGAKQFAKLAAAEIRHYRRQYAGFTAAAVVRDDIYSGLLTTGGHLLIGGETSIAARRAEALLQHEIGTHLVTYYNGQAQPLRLLKVGLAGYDGLQEGLAVLSEYLVGGLSRGRLRTLAARVVAADHMIRGASFVETFQDLVSQHGFQPRTAYTITLRIFRGGGLTKDAVYLRGLLEMLRYVGKEGDLQPLLVGKIAADHIPIVQELLLRGVLQQPPLRPRYLDDAVAASRLQRLRQGCSVVELTEC